MYLQNLNVFSSEISRIACPCGGWFDAVETTLQEDAEYGCGRTNCCVETIECDKCHQRINFRRKAPDMETGVRE